MRGAVLGAALFLSCAAAGFSQETVGSVTYLLGDVRIVRDGGEITDVAIGDAIQAFDLVHTGTDGQAELSLGGNGVAKMTVKVSADTQVSIETATLSTGTHQTSLGILGGALSLKVQKLLGTEGVLVRTDTAAMGVRGTEFSVTAPATGDVLVTCLEGDVLCTDDQNRELHAIPGSAVEKRAGESYQTLAVQPTEVDQYRARWAGEREQALERNALPLIRANARLYLRLTRELREESAELARNRAIIDMWRGEDRAGRIGQRASLAGERRAIGAVLRRMRRTQFQLERVSFRLERLRRLHERGIGTGTIDGGVASTAFFNQVERERAEVRGDLWETRALTKMYARRSNGELP